jgi:monoterpene epsilon-lactone hydrolase
MSAGERAETKAAADALATLRAALKARQRYGDLAKRRQVFQTNMARYAPARDVTFSQEKSLTAEWSSSPGCAQDRVILFLHGGGYILGSTATHRHMVSELGKLARCRTLAPDYRLAPEQPFPAAIDDCFAAYRFLLEEGLRADNIAIAGDSAGGGLTMATMLRIKEAGLPQPACALCVSPWVDLAMAGDSITDKAAADPFVEEEDLRMMAHLYLGTNDPRQPMASPLYADLEGLPPLLFQVGSDEVLLDDAVRLSRAAGAADVRIQLQIWPGMIHVWHLFYQELPQGRAALQSGADFIKQAMDARA